MTQISPVFVRRRARLAQIVSVAHRYGLADWAARADGLGVTDRIARRLAEPELVGLSTGARLRGALTELGTTWIKFGQMLSLRADLVGDEIAAELERLHHEVPPDPPGVARALVEAELGRPIDELFASFDEEPFASGSVAQVHRATLHDGTEVAVKVLHHGTADEVLGDLELMRALAHYLESRDPDLARFRPTAVVGEFEQMLRAAIDLREELRNLEQFRANFADDPDVVIPAPHRDHSSAQVLTMDFVAGPAVTDRAAVEAAGWDVDELVARIADVYLVMVFRDGLYHADPHPRNLVLCGPTKFAMLDFGDVGRVSRPRRRQLQSIAIAVGSRDAAGVADVVIEMTSPPPGTDLERVRADLEAWLERYLRVDVADLDMLAILESGLRVMHDHRLRLPADLSLMFRVLARLQGLAHALDSDVQVATMLQPYVGSLVLEQADPVELARRMGRAAHRWERLLSTLPDDLRALVAQARSGELGVDVRVRDVDRQIDHLVDGLVASASVLASSQLLSRRTQPTVAGVSVPGLVAAAIAAITWRRLAAKRSGHRGIIARSRRLLR